VSTPVKSFPPNDPNLRNRLKDSWHRRFPAIDGCIHWLCVVFLRHTTWASAPSLLGAAVFGVASTGVAIVDHTNPIARSLLYGAGAFYVLMLSVGGLLRVREKRRKRGSERSVVRQLLGALTKCLASSNRKVRATWFMPDVIHQDIVVPEVRSHTYSLPRCFYPTGVSFTGLALEPHLQGKFLVYQCPEFESPAQMRAHYHDHLKIPSDVLARISDEMAHVRTIASYCMKDTTNGVALGVLSIDFFQTPWTAPKTLPEELVRILELIAGATYAFKYDFAGKPK
jgi:hypothetical protein